LPRRRTLRHDYFVVTVDSFLSVWKRRCSFWQFDIIVIRIFVRLVL
jgi:hypothetical protein